MTGMTKRAGTKMINDFKTETIDKLVQQLEGIMNGDDLFELLDQCQTVAGFTEPVELKDAAEQLQVVISKLRRAKLRIR